METQIRKIQNHLQRYDHITSWEAIEKYHCTRLAAVIHTLRTEKGWVINTLMHYENNKSWAQYSLIKSV